MYKPFLLRLRKKEPRLLLHGSHFYKNIGFSLFILEYTVVCGVTIGEYALIGSGAVINKDVKPYALMVGVPAKQIGWVSKAGNTLSFDENNEAIDSFDNSQYVIMNGEYT